MPRYPSVLILSLEEGHSLPTGKASCLGLKMTTVVGFYENVVFSQCVDQDEVRVGDDISLHSFSCCSHV